jgi:hypothetical protein
VIVNYNAPILEITSNDNSSHGILVRGTGSTAAGAATIKVSGLGGTHIETMGDPTSAIHFIEINLGTGSDQVIMQSIHLSGGISIDTNAGSDIVNVVNVSCGLFTATLEAGNDVATFVNVHTTQDNSFGVFAGSGRDVVVLNHVTAGFKGSGATLAVDVGAAGGGGSHDSLVVIGSSADNATFADTDGIDGTLVWKHNGNHFTTQSITGFATVV